MYWEASHSCAKSSGCACLKDPRFFIGAPKEAKVYCEAVQDGVVQDSQGVLRTSGVHGVCQGLW